MTRRSRNRSRIQKLATLDHDALSAASGGQEAITFSFPGGREVACKPAICTLTKDPHGKPGSPSPAGLDAMGIAKRMYNGGPNADGSSVSGYLEWHAKPAR
jgi:hypothetical protein